MSLDQREERLRQLGDGLQKGVAATEVVRLAVEWLGVSPRQAWRDLAEVRRRWAAEARLPREQRGWCFALAMRRREGLFRQALLAGDVLGALEVEKDVCQLLGLYPPKRTAQTLTSARQWGPHNRHALTPADTEGGLSMATDLPTQQQLAADVQAEQQAQALAQLAAGVTTLAALLTLCGGADEVERFRAEVNRIVTEKELEAMCLQQPSRSC
jgi:hypothetical protein